MALMFNYGLEVFGNPLYVLSLIFLKIAKNVPLFSSPGTCSDTK